MKRTALKRKSPLRSRKASRVTMPKRTSYATRERAFDYMGWVKQLPCMVPQLATNADVRADTAGLLKCYGGIEADHAGTRGLGRKAPDATCIPLCTLHHRHRTEYAGAFNGFDRHRMREWCDAAVLMVQGHARAIGVTVPDGM